MAISPQTLEYSRKIAEKHKLGFDILIDPGNEVAAQFGLKHRLPEYLQKLYQGFGADLTQFNGEPSWTLPMPARYVIGSDATIRSADVNPDYTIRPEPEETIEALRAMS